MIMGVMKLKNANIFPENLGMSSENRWLEDVFPIEIVPF